MSVGNVFALIRDFGHVEPQAREDVIQMNLIEENVRDEETETAVPGIAEDINKGSGSIRTIQMIKNSKIKQQLSIFFIFKN
jgi:hypothetical protein